MAKLKCSKCSRTFSMPAHLARHQSAVHGMKSKRITSAGARRKPGRPARAARASMVSGAGMGPGADRILSEMSSYREQLVAQRESIEEQLGALEGAMSAMGSGRMMIPSRSGAGRSVGRPSGRGPGRPKGSGNREGTLKSTMIKVLKQTGSPMSPQAIASAVIRAGYKTKTSNLTKAVSNALPTMKEIRRVGRGQYRA